MNVQMGNRLSAVASTIDDHAKSCLRDSKRFGHFLGFEQQFTQQNSVLRRCFGETRYRLFRHQEHMNRCLRVDIVKNDQFVIFQDDLCRNLARDNFLEQCHLMVRRISVFTLARSRCARRKLTISLRNCEQPRLQVFTDCKCRTHDCSP